MKISSLLQIQTSRQKLGKTLIRSYLPEELQPSARWLPQKYRSTEDPHACRPGEILLTIFDAV